jgi:membrane protein
LERLYRGGDPREAEAEGVMRTIRRHWRWLRHAFVLAYTRNCFSTAKGAAYSGLLALFPVLSAGAAILVHAKAGPVREQLAAFLAEILPPGTEEMVLERFVASGERPVTLLIGAAALAVYAASGLMMSLMEGFNSVYGIERGRSCPKQRAVAALLVFGTAVPGVVASMLILFGSRTETTLIAWLRGAPEGVPLARGVLVAGQAARYLVAFGTVVLTTSLLYGVGPHRKQRWRVVWPGALMATVLWLGATVIFAWYVRYLAGYNVMYGSLGTVIALLAWMYVMALIACIGCAHNAVIERTRRRGAGNSRVTDR